MKKIKYTLSVIFMLAAGLAAGAFAETGAPPSSDSSIMTHDECIQHLFEHLELVEQGTVLSVNEKMESLVQLNFQPRMGYVLGQPLLFGQIADILFHVYGLEDQIDETATETQVIQLLFDKKILETMYSADYAVTRELGVVLINSIPQSPIYKQRTVLLPRGFKEPVMSRCE